MWWHQHNIQTVIQQSIWLKIQKWEDHLPAKQLIFSTNGSSNAIMKTKKGELWWNGRTGPSISKYVTLNMSLPTKFTAAEHHHAPRTLSVDVPLLPAARPHTHCRDPVCVCEITLTCLTTSLFSPSFSPHFWSDADYVHTLTHTHLINVCNDCPGLFGGQIKGVHTLH